MPLFHVTNKLDRAFEISLLLKGLDGLLETVSGFLFLFVKPELVMRLAHGVVGYHPTNFISEHILKSAQNFSKGTAVFAALYLMSHGVVKLVLVVEILREHLWAYIGLIVVTSGFIIYQLYHIFFTRPSFSFISLTIFDFIVVYLTIKEYGRQKVRLSGSKVHGVESEV